MKKILIIGAGWLGLPFAQQLSALKHQVIVTRRSTDSLREVPLAQESKAVLNLANDDAAKKVRELVDNNAIDIVVGSFPPVFEKVAVKNMPISGKKSSMASRIARYKKSLWSARRRFTQINPSR